MIDDWHYEKKKMAARRKVKCPSCDGDRFIYVTMAGKLTNVKCKLCKASGKVTMDLATKFNRGEIS